MRPRLIPPRAGAQGRKLSSLDAGWLAKHSAAMSASDVMAACP